MVSLVQFLEETFYLLECHPPPPLAEHKISNGTLTMDKVFKSTTKVTFNVIHVCGEEVL